MNPNLLSIRPFHPSDSSDLWAILQAIVRAADTYALPADYTREQTLRYWLSPDHEVFVAVMDGVVVGTYYLKANQRGGGCHVANCGYATATAFSGQGIASAMCAHSLQAARERGFTAMQFNFVVSTNQRAIALWERNGFAIVGCLPAAFRHPTFGFVNAFVMHRAL